MSSQTPAGWYRDTENPDQERYWDGGSWSEHRRPATPPPPSATNQQAGGGSAAPTSSKATTSLVLGILSLVCCGLLAGIPAMIIGRQASREINESKGRIGGAGLATAGFITGLIGTVLTSLVLVITLAPGVLMALAEIPQ